VTLNDQAVNGMVVFVYPDSKEIMAPTGIGGTYTIPNAPTGQVKVLVKAKPGAGPLVKPKGGAEMPGSMEGGGAGEGVPPPAKYATVATSDLTYEVKAGKQDHNIPLK